MNDAKACSPRAIMSDAIPPPAGHYSHAFEHAGILYVSGQLPINSAGQFDSASSIEVQTEQALANLEAILKSGGSDKDSVLKMTVYISDIALWGRVNAVYAKFFGAHRPARTVVPTRELHFSALVEIDAIAAIRSR